VRQWHTLQSAVTGPHALSGITGGTEQQSFDFLLLKAFQPARQTLNPAAVKWWSKPKTERMRCRFINGMKDNP
jgi:hypothetical protein